MEGTHEVNEPVLYKMILAYAKERGRAGVTVVEVDDAAGTRGIEAMVDLIMAGRIVLSGRSRKGVPTYVY
jgi:hypothetical protein